MKKLFAVLCCTAVLAAPAVQAETVFPTDQELEMLLKGERKDPQLEKQIERAVKPFADRKGWQRQTGPNLSGAGVYYMMKKDGRSDSCEGIGACTTAAVYYNLHSRCTQTSLYSKTRFERNQGNGRDIYFTTHKNVCYQISVNGKSNGQAIAQALKKGM